MKTNIRALNACLGIDGPDWMEMDDDIEETKAYGFALFGELNPQYGKPSWNKGKNWSEEFKDKITGEGNGMSQWWKITFDDGKQLVMCGLSNWCKDNGYCKGHVSRVYRKERKRHKDIVTVEKVAPEVATGCQA